MPALNTQSPSKRDLSCKRFMWTKNNKVGSKIFGSNLQRVNFKLITRLKLALIAFNSSFRTTTKKNRIFIFLLFKNKMQNGYGLI